MRPNQRNKWAHKFLPFPAVIECVVETILEDKKYKVLGEFTSIYGIGAMTAQMLYARKCRTLEDVKQFYSDPSNANQEISDDDDSDYEDENESVPERWIQISLALKDDLSIK